MDCTSHHFVVHFTTGVYQNERYILYTRRTEILCDVGHVVWLVEVSEVAKGLVPGPPVAVLHAVREAQQAARLQDTCHLDSCSAAHLGGQLVEQVHARDLEGGQYG